VVIIPVNASVIPSMLGSMNAPAEMPAPFSGSSLTVGTKCAHTATAVEESPQSRPASKIRECLINGRPLERMLWSDLADAPAERLRAAQTRLRRAGWILAIMVIVLTITISIK
jgi:hypothetical protein